ncbi:hypothetical protein BACCIP111883_00724 [Sutcliffiella rhizosphaerae]|uniref:Uncharacterized protein n=1 Tax=Sutcliffiella rhizosphaerae TaxID=2880967 RepID=A0ABM8YJ63_9BACI|nr:hypothetical protein BACCIP111883_00724 [Sutcliffiella rhizosphaerae]
MFFIVVAIVASIGFFNTCVTIAKKVKNGQDERSDKYVVSCMLGIALFCILTITAH